ncbi:hypothetical protein GCM10011578_051570 [Streptomyces fuscichromogenes]|uniref:Uncharacterized protein n=1 Tax=Streptomyces fuscichromogenes TaxID=1324013 RepID=A0A918CT86_9ACTN|nr:hypothetical protein GCM10011578_051570 [Streptomyces fuscichromogenes]
MPLVMRFSPPADGVVTSGVVTTAPPRSSRGTDAALMIVVIRGVPLQYDVPDTRTDGRPRARERVPPGVQFYLALREV